MAADRERFSLVRVSRQNPTRNPVNENPIDPQFDTSIHQKTRSNRKEGHPKVDLTAGLNIPRLSVVKIDEPTSLKINPPTHRHSVIVQPRQSQTWVKRSSLNITRPELNWKGTNPWSYGVCSCCHDLNMCCYACACWCCFRHEISTMMGEHWCVWFLNCAPLMELRTKFRQQYAIEGSIAKDFCCAIFCPLCIALQLANEGRDRGHRIFN